MCSRSCRACVFYLFFIFFSFLFLTPCFRVGTVCTIVAFCSHVGTTCTCESVRHTYVREHVSDRSVCGYGFFLMYIFFWVRARVCPCPAMCSPRARGMLVVCSWSSCAHRVLVLWSPFARACRVLAVDSSCVQCARRGLVLAVYSSWVRGVLAV